MGPSGEQPQACCASPICSESGARDGGKSCPEAAHGAPRPLCPARCPRSCAPSSAARDVGRRAGLPATRRPRLLHSALRRETLRRERQEREQLSHPAHFGPRKYCLRECICEVEGQVPCPAVVPLPRELTGKFQAALRAGAQD